VVAAASHGGPTLRRQLTELMSATALDEAGRRPVAHPDRLDRARFSA
jgi:hypothetical protein